MAIDGPNRGDFRAKLRRRRKDRLFQTKEAELEMKDEHETQQNKTKHVDALVNQPSPARESSDGGEDCINLNNLLYTTIVKIIPTRDAIETPI